MLHPFCVFYNCEVLQRWARTLCLEDNYEDEQDEDEHDDGDGASCQSAMALEAGMAGCLQMAAGRRTQAGHE